MPPRACNGRACSTLVRSFCQGTPAGSTTCGFNVFGTMAPSPAELRRARPARTSADGTPGLVLNIRYPPEPAAALVAARDSLVALLDGADLRPRVALWLIDPVGSAVHYAGTCRMHASPQFGMLDALEPAARGAQRGRRRFGGVHHRARKESRC